MVYLIHKKLIKSSTDTLIKTAAKQNMIIGVIEKERHSQNCVFF